MNKEKANEIYNNLVKEWKKRHPEKKLDVQFLAGIRRMLEHCPDEDGLKRVTDMETGKTHLVPYEDMILNGLNGSEVSKYPEEKK